MANIDVTIFLTGKMVTRAFPLNFFFKTIDFSLLYRAFQSGIVLMIIDVFGQRRLSLVLCVPIVGIVSCIWIIGAFAAWSG